MMASEILTLMGSTTDSMLNGPSSLSASCIIASESINNTFLIHQNENIPDSILNMLNLRQDGEPSDRVGEPADR
jgi:hypothetical protein